MIVYIYTLYICTYIHWNITQYYSNIKKNETLPFAAAWMDLEMITLSEKARQRQPSLISCRSSPIRSSTVSNTQ